MRDGDIGLLFQDRAAQQYAVLSGLRRSLRGYRERGEQYARVQDETGRLGYGDQPSPPMHQSYKLRTREQCLPQSARE